MLNVLQSALCDVNHFILCSLGVGHPALTAVWEASRRHGMACKLTGAGGGGCAFTVLPPASTSADTEIANLQHELRYETS
jgi:mevalonate kinase